MKNHYEYEKKGPFILANQAPNTSNVFQRLEVAHYCHHHNMLMEDRRVLDFLHKREDGIYKLLQLMVGSGNM